MQQKKDDLGNTGYLEKNLLHLSNRFRRPSLENYSLCLCYQKFLLHRLLKYSRFLAQNISRTFLGFSATSSYASNELNLEVGKVSSSLVSR